METGRRQSFASQLEHRSRSSGLSSVRFMSIVAVFGDWSWRSEVRKSQTLERISAAYMSDSLQLSDRACATLYC